VKAIVDPLAGFCGGVSRAIELVEQALSRGEKLAVKGELIHNRLEVDRLYTLGLESINQLEEARESTVLVRTHGEESSFFQQAKELKILYLDATCPKVMRSQKVIRRAHKEGKQIVVVGHLNHPEVIALQGHCDGDAIVVNKDEVTAIIDAHRPTLLIAQTTVDPGTYANWQEKLRREVNDLEVFDSRCSFVNRRQKELREFASEHPAIIFVGGRHSSNTRLLYNICLNANPNTLFIEDEKELDWEWLKQFDEVGISGSASTPMWLLKKVAEAVLEKF
jgi:4-hydroxy-3-methylbut-2-enyl diphosphate reductase